MADTGKTKIVNGFVESDVKLKGKTTLITGSNSGIGTEVALDFARRGARVIMACRDLEKADTVKAKLLEEVSDADLVIVKLDLSSLASVRECANKVIETESRLDILVNNAGVMLTPAWKTKDGYEMQMGVNHIGHFLLTNLLLDLIKKSAPSRIILVSSLGHSYANITWDDIMLQKKYNSLTAYGNSKLANILHCKELSKRLEGTGVTCNVLHPGNVATDLGRYLQDLSHLPWTTRLKVRMLLLFFKPTQVTPKKGAQTTIYCAVAPELADTTGKYFSDCAEKDPDPKANNEADAKKLWEMSEEWTKPKVVKDEL